MQRAFEMYHSTNWTERNEAIRELQKLPAKKKRSREAENKAIIFLVAAASEDQHTMVRIEAINMLAEYLPEQRAFECLKTIAIRDKHDNVRWMTLKVLAQKPPPEALDVFIVNSSSRDLLIRETAVMGMLMVRSDGVEKTILPYVKKALRDPAISVKTAALNNLYFRDESLYPIITAFIKDDNVSLTLLASALRALKGYKMDDETEGRVILLLAHSQADIRILALHALQNQKS